MSESKNPDSVISDEELIAYLDGELDSDAARRIDQRLAGEPELQARLQQHQRAWAMLDELPHTDVGDRFTQTTVEMVAVSLADHQADAKRSNTARSKLAWVLGGLLSVAAAFFGYVLVASILHSPNRQLVKDLSIVENLDEYRAAEDIEFLRALEREGLFTVEVDSEL